MMNSDEIRFVCPKCGCNFLTERRRFVVEEGVVFNTVDKEVWHDEEIYREIEEIEPNYYQCEECEFRPPCDTWKGLENWLEGMEMIAREP